MAKFSADFPNDLMKQLSELADGDMTKEMLEAGAEVVRENIEKNLPDGIKNSEGMMNCLSETKVYSTPTDDSLNIKVGFFGYFINENGKKTPAPLVANVFEYGRSDGKFPKQPFMRKSFSKKQITAAMNEVQKKYIPGGD